MNTYRALLSLIIFGASANAIAHPGHGATTVHAHPILSTVVIVALVAGLCWFAASKGRRDR